MDNKMESNRKKRAEFSHIGEVLPQLLKNVRKESDSDLSRIRNAWNRIIDPVIADNAQPAALKADILLVHVSSTTVTHQLRFVTADIIDQINRVMGEARIRRIKYKVGNIP